MHIKGTKNQERAGKFPWVCVRTPDYPNFPATMTPGSKQSDIHDDSNVHIFRWYTTIVETGPYSGRDSFLGMARQILVMLIIQGDPESNNMTNTLK